MAKENEIRYLKKRLDEKNLQMRDAREIIKKIVNGKAPDKSKIEVLKDLFEREIVGGKL